MNVGELINLLKTFNSEMDVVTRGYEFGYEDELCIFEMEIHCNANSVHYAGPHERIRSVEDLKDWEKDDPDEVQALIERNEKRKHLKRKRVLHVGR